MSPNMNNAGFFAIKKEGDKVVGVEPLKQGDKRLELNTQVELPKVESKKTEVEVEPVNLNNIKKIDPLKYKGHPVITEAQINEDKARKELKKLNNVGFFKISDVEDYKKRDDLRKAEELKEKIKKVVEEAREAAL